MKISFIKTAVMAAALLGLSAEALSYDRGRGYRDDFRRGGHGGLEQTYRIDMYDRVYQGGKRNGIPNTLKLKKLIRQAYPNARLNDEKLIQVKLVAKSARGHGSAELFIAGQRVDDQNVQIFMGRRSRDLRDAFEFGGPRTFDRVILSPLRGRQVKGPWQIDLRGKIKVRRLVVTTKVKRGHGGGGGHGRVVEIPVGSAQLSKHYSSVERIYTNQNNVVEVTLSNRNKMMRIDSVEVVGPYGRSQTLWQLSGNLRPGAVKTAQLRGGAMDIQTIRITGESLESFRGAGKIDVSVGVLGRRGRH